jgi:hypothetical protein
MTATQGNGSPYVSSIQSSGNLSDGAYYTATAYTEKTPPPHLSNSAGKSSSTANANSLSVYGSSIAASCSSHSPRSSPRPGQASQEEKSGETNRGGEKGLDSSSQSASGKKSVLSAAEKSDNSNKRLSANAVLAMANSTGVGLSPQPLTSTSGSNLGMLFF